MSLQSYWSKPFWFSLVVIAAVVGGAAPARGQQVPILNLDTVPTAPVGVPGGGTVAIVPRSFEGLFATVGSRERPRAPASVRQPDPAATPPTRNALKWEIEVHGGWALNGGQTGGSGSLPPSGALVGRLISVSSFYFGSGAQLFNQNGASVSRAQPLATITPLDPILLSSAIQRQRQGGTVGVRVGRALSQRLAADITLDFSPGNLAFTDGAVTGIEATRASFIPALQQVLAVAQVPSTVTSVATVSNQARASQLAATGALLINLRETGKAIPYVVIGGGVVLNTGDTPSATLVGNYQIGMTSAQLFGTDTVDLRYERKTLTPVGIGGGGFKYSVTSSWGVRVDARAQLAQTTLVNLVNTTPVMALGSSTGVPYPLINAGTLQFSTTAPLTGVPISATPGTKYATGGLPPGFGTFTGGWQTHVSVTIGLSWRF